MGVRFVGVLAARAIFDFDLGSWDGFFAFSAGAASSTLFRDVFVVRSLTSWTAASRVRSGELLDCAVSQLELELSEGVGER